MKIVQRLMLYPCSTRNSTVVFEVESLWLGVDWLYFILYVRKVTSSGKEDFWSCCDIRTGIEKLGH